MTDRFTFRRLKKPLAVVALLALVTVTGALKAKEYISGKVWPEPKIVEPGSVGGPPADAIVLFGGKDLTAWEGGDKWEIADGVATAKGGGITTKQPFGDCQLHVEWAEPSVVTGSGQGRGNSGVYLQGNYEVQILDSYDNKTYFDGQCGSVYKQTPPLVNVCRKPGEWQSYDIIFEAPKFDASGNLTKPAFITALQNGVLILNHFQVEGASAWDAPPKYTAHEPKLPLSIQFHGNPVRFRNLWIREL
ncbi:MAG TPA: DUF1080 domain-containing protein [Pirellulales bacterium]|jgi:hypothetical protein